VIQTTTLESREVAFALCPLDYCCTSEGTLGTGTSAGSGAATGLTNLPYAYCAASTCAGQRTGTLCGSCMPGYSQSLSGVQCVTDDQCHAGVWVIPLLVVFGLGYAAYVLVSAMRGIDPSAEPDGMALILFSFFQTVSILMVGNNPSSEFASVIVNVFNLRVPFLDSSSGGTGTSGICAWPGMTAVDKITLGNLTSSVWFTGAS
jgi:hypothetical protein